MCSAVVEQPIAFVNHDTTSVTVANLNFASCSSPCSLTVRRHCRVHGYNSTHSRMRSIFARTSVQRLSSKKVRQIEIRQPDYHQPSPSSIYTAQVGLKCVIRTPGSRSVSVCPVRTSLGVDRKILSIRRKHMLSDFLSLKA